MFILTEFVTQLLPAKIKACWEVSRKYDGSINDLAGLCKGTFKQGKVVFALAKKRPGAYTCLKVSLVDSKSRTNDNMDV